MRYVLVGQAGAALVAAGFKHLLPGLGGHALHEAMLAGALSFLGLESPFRHNFIFLSRPAQAMEGPTFI